jgi:hypothetical protein
MSDILTLFSAPKPFSDPHINVIQRNAIRSWTCLPNTKIILFGNEPGIAEVAQELGVTHIKELPRSPSGAPLMDSMFRFAREASNTPLYCIVNADIILFPDFTDIAAGVAKKTERFVLMGQRWDLTVTDLIDFSPTWVAEQQERITQEGTLHKAVGSDYFLFPEACYKDLPAFTIGRAGWDNWMIYSARKNGFPAIDCTKDITIIHQNHDYSHLPGAKPHYDHPETLTNIALAGGRVTTRFTLFDANKQLENGQIKNKGLSRRSIWRAIESFPFLFLGSEKLSNYLWVIGKKLGLNQ